MNVKGEERLVAAYNGCSGVSILEHIPGRWAGCASSGVRTIPISKLS